MAMNIRWLSEQKTCKSFKAGEVIPCPCAKPSEPKVMYILLEGGVDVFGKSAAGGVKKISSVEPGDVFGGREYFAGTDDHYYRAREDSNTFVLTEESFKELTSQPDILFEILKSAYIPARKPVSNQKPAENIFNKATGTGAVKPAAKEAAPEVSAAPAVNTSAAAAASPGGDSPCALYPEGHKTYTDKEFDINESLIFQKEYTCPFCKKPFPDFRVFRSKLYENRPMRFDTRKFFTGFIPEWYDLITCHNCYFTTFHNYFTDPKPIKRDAVEWNLASIRANYPIVFNNTSRDINHVFTMHYLALFCCDGYPSLSKQLRAKIWGNLSWLYEDVEDKEMEKYATLKAVEAYEDVYSSSRLTPVQEQIICLSIAGMQYRAGVDNNMKKYIFSAKTNSMGDRSYAKLADDFWYELQMEETP